MAYNRFQWWKSGMGREVTPLKGASHTLYDRIKHGDYDYPYTYLSAIEDVELEIKTIALTVTKKYTGRSKSSLESDIRDATRMKNVRKNKLQLEMYDKDRERLDKLAVGLHTEFGVNLWEDMQNLNFDSFTSIDDLYNEYKRRHSSE